MMAGFTTILALFLVALVFSVQSYPQRNSLDCKDNAVQGQSLETMGPQQPSDQEAKEDANFIMNFILFFKQLQILTTIQNKFNELFGTPVEIISFEATELGTETAEVAPAKSFGESAVKTENVPEKSSTDNEESGRQDPGIYTYSRSNSNKVTNSNENSQNTSITYSGAIGPNGIPGVEGALPSPADTTPAPTTVAATTAEPTEVAATTAEPTEVAATTEADTEASATTADAAETTEAGESEATTSAATDATATSEAPAETTPEASSESGEATATSEAPSDSSEASASESSSESSEATTASSGEEGTSSSEAPVASSAGDSGASSSSANTSSAAGQNGASATG